MCRDTGQGRDTEGTPLHCCGQWVSSPIVPILGGPTHIHTHRVVSLGMSPLHAECHQWLQGPVWPPVLRGAVVWVAL